MRFLARLLRRRHTSWSTQLVVGSIVLVAVSMVLCTTTLAPMLVTTLGALAGGAGFALGVSVETSAFFQRESYGDSDFDR
jgi:O-antigen ligase